MHAFIRPFALAVAGLAATLAAQALELAKYPQVFVAPKAWRLSWPPARMASRLWCA